MIQNTFVQTADCVGDKMTSKSKCCIHSQEYVSMTALFLPKTRLIDHTTVALKICSLQDFEY